MTSSFEKNNRVIPLTVLLKKQKTAIGHPVGHIFLYTSIYFLYVHGGNRGLDLMFSSFLF